LGTHPLPPKHPGLGHNPWTRAQPVRQCAGADIYREQLPGTHRRPACVGRGRNRPRRSRGARRTGRSRTRGRNRTGRPDDRFMVRVEAGKDMALLRSMQRSRLTPIVLPVAPSGPHSPRSAITPMPGVTTAQGVYSWAIRCSTRCTCATRTI